MEYTQLGRTDLHVSRLAFGTWSFGGDWGPVQVDDGKAAIRAALDLGINFFDTAQAYGWSVSESALGEALGPEIRSHRHNVVLATKGGLRQDGENVLVADAVEGALLGLVDAYFLSHEGGKRAERKNKSFAEKDSRRWLTGRRTSAAAGCGRLRGCIPCARNTGE